MVEDAPRLDLNGQVAGVVTAAQARYAKHQASLQRGKGGRGRAKPNAGAAAGAPAVEQKTD